MHPSVSSPSRAPRLRMLALPLVASFALSACNDGGGDVAPSTGTAAPAQSVADTPPPAAEEAVDAGDTDTATAVIGRTLPPYPQGLNEVQGVCVPGGEQPERICDYGMAVLGRETIDGTATGVYLIASANIEPDAKQPLWRVTDALDAPRVENGQELQLGGCRLDGELRNEIVALVRHGDQEYSAEVAWARRLDIASGKFIAVELARVDCVNAGYGV